MAPAIVMTMAKIFGALYGTVALLGARTTGLAWVPIGAAVCAL